MKLHPYDPDQYEHRVAILKEREAPLIDQALLEIGHAAALLGKLKAKNEKAFNDSGLPAIHDRLSIINPESRDEISSIFHHAGEVGTAYTPAQAIHFAQFSKTFEKEIILAYRNIVENTLPSLERMPAAAFSSEDRQWFVGPAKVHLEIANELLGQIVNQLRQPEAHTY